MDCPPGSARFINAVAGLVPRAAATPRSLLSELQSLEKAMGRAPKKIHNEPRVIDLDLIAFGSQTVAAPDLVLPHPRASLRRFVLQPMSEIAPDYKFPGQEKTVADLLQGLDSSETLRRLPDSSTGSKPATDYGRARWRR